MKIRSQINKLRYSLLILICFSCSKKQDETNSPGTIKANEFKFKNEGILTDWRCFDVDKDKVCVPDKWETIKGHTFHFFANVKTEERDNNFFVVVRYDTSVVEVDLEKYLQEVVKQVKADTNEISKEGNFRYLTFEGSPPCYFGEFITEINGKQYHTYLMYTIRFGYLYDFTLKTQAVDKDNLYRDFRNVLFNYQVGSQYLFKKEDPIVSIKLIDPNTFL